MTSYFIIHNSDFLFSFGSDFRFLRGRRTAVGGQRDEPSIFMFALTACRGNHAGCTVADRDRRATPPRALT